MSINKINKKKKCNLNLRYFIFGLTAILLIAFISILQISFVSAQVVSYCCEKTVNGAWCQDSSQENCDDNFRMAPTSCEATSYCKLGTCYDSQEGTCMENTPQKVCEDEGGVWEDAPPDELPQCGLGCCLIGDQASFVTQTRCNRLSSLYGLEINFRTDISSEVACIASATSDVKGACVFEKDFERTCLFTTKKECDEMNLGDSETEFYENLLCSAETLGTNCGPTEQTTCVEGRDEVYFVDSCGNLANIYDANRINDKVYWKEVVGKAEACGAGSSNKDSSNCGNCDYFLGSTCKAYQRGQDARPMYGDFICRDLSCEYLGKEYKHGETWCADAGGVDESLPGSRHFRLLCYDGEVMIEPCADFRQEVCLESEVNGFSTAACRVNMWQDCTAQTTQTDCENLDRRDCKWIGDNTPGIKCVPLNAPGFDFWQGGDAQSICDTASTQCVVTYKEGIIGDKECEDNCECLSSAWEAQMNNVCTALGDCGSSVNYIGIQGYEHEDVIKKD